MNIVYDTFGGAEGMTDAVFIMDGDRIVATIDLAGFGQEPCQYIPDEKTARRLYPEAFVYAHKLAAADDLLDALKEIAAFYGSYHEVECPCDDTCRCKHKPFNDRVNRAINKAEGED
jgi:hypothetical protein